MTVGIAAGLVGFQSTAHPPGEHFRRPVVQPSRTAVGGSRNAPSSPILVGEYGSFTGDTATWGIDTDRGIQLAVDRANAAGGVLGKRVRVIRSDDGSTWQQAAPAVESLLDQQVAAVLGEIASSRSLRGAPLCQGARVPMISPASTNPKVTQVGNYSFRVCFTDPYQGQEIAAIGTDVLHAKTAAILYDNSQDYSKGLASVIHRSFEVRGGRVVSELTYNMGDVDFTSQLTSIQARNPNVIFVPGYYLQVAQIAVHARRLGMKQPLVGGDGWDSPELTKSAGDSLDNCYFTDHFAPDDPDPAVQRFVAAYRTRYGMEPDAMAALGYDAAGLLVDAIKRANSTSGPALRGALASTGDYPGVTGNITIGPGRVVRKPVIVIKIIRRKFTFYRRLQA